MVTRYLFGSPVETEAVITPVETSQGFPPALNVLQQKEGLLSFSCKLEEEDIVYGLGEAPGGINKRGHLYESFNSDDPCHTEEKKSLYGSHNLIVIDGSRHLGMFVDCGASVTFDIGYTDPEVLTISPSVGDFVLYTIEGSSSEDILHQFRKIIGRSYMAPRWAFGFQQSRWSYATAEEVRSVVSDYREHHIPLDAVYLDIDYMEDYKDFTVSEERFPEFDEFVREMRQEGIRLVPIIDAGVKIEDGYDIFEEGKKNGYFCKRQDGTDFVAGVWPGRTHFPDFLNKDARRWFGEKYKCLLDCGIEGFWNDMNEPAMFFTEEGIKKVKSYLADFDFSDQSANHYFELTNQASGLANRREDYAAFYHHIHGKFVRHDLVHNLYGYNMTRAAGEAFEKLYPDKRLLLFSRSSYIGMHRYGGIWTGDNQSWWSHLVLNLKMMPSLNMCGFLYCGADLGGFGSHCTRDLLLRWLALGIFTPLMRNHSAYGTRRQECTCFGDSKAFEGIISLRYRLIPYLYSEYMKACLEDRLMFRPLAFQYPEDKIARHIEDQLLVGESIMIAPIVEQNAVGRTVYLPEDMKLLLFRDAQVVREKILSKGWHYFEAALDEVPVFLRKNKLLPLCEPAETTDALDFGNLELMSFNDREITYLLYDDDGLSKYYRMPGNQRLLTVKEPD